MPIYRIFIEYTKAIGPFQTHVDKIENEGNLENFIEMLRETEKRDDVKITQAIYIDMK